MADDVLNLAGRFHSTADDNKALDAIEVFDSTRDDKRQKHFNDDIVRLDEQINNTDGLKDRLEAVEDMASIQVDGGDVQIASTITPSTEGGKIPTVDAVKGHATAKSTFTTGESVDNIGIDSEPTAGSNNLVKSGGVKSAIQNAKNRQYYTSYFQDRKFWDEVDYINGWRNQKDASYQIGYNFVTLKFDISQYISKELNIFFTTAADSYHYFGDGTNAFALFVVEDENGNNTIYSDTHPTYKQVNHTVTFNYTPTSGDKYLYISIVKNYGTVSVVSNYDYSPLFLLPTFKNDQYFKLNGIVNYLGSSEVKVTSQKFITQKVQSINLFNTEDEDILVNQMYSGNTLITYNGFNTSGFIPLHKGEILKYTSIGTGAPYTTWPYLQVTLFDVNKNLISFISNPSTIGYVTTDLDNCAYIRFTYEARYANHIVISYDENVSEYVEFYDLENIYNETKSIRDDISGDFSEALIIDWAYDKNFWFVQNTTVSHNSGSYNDYKAGIVDVSQLVGKSIIINVASNSQDNTSPIGSVFADDNLQIKGNYFEIKPNAKPYTVTVPSGATQLCITCYKPSIETDDGVYFSIPIGKDVEKLDNNVKSLMSKFDFNNNQWQGKKILWLGTSIPWGQSDEDNPGTTSRVAHPYPQQVCDALGATLIDSTHGGLAQMAAYDEASGKWYPLPYTPGGTSSGGSTCLTIAECQAAYSAGLVNADLSAFSYENTLLGKNADLYVFDVEPNNIATGSADDLALFDWRLWKYTDDSTFASHRNTYIGALIYEIDKLLTEKPDAIIVFVGEYFYMSTSNYNIPFTVREQSEALCEKFHMGYINLAKKVFYVGKNRTVWVNSDNVHPKQAAYNRMAKMLINELLLIA